MNELLDIARLAAERIKSKESVIQVVSHYDADGIAAASIMTRALLDINKKFQVSIIKKITPEFIEELKKREPEVVVFCDLGSGYMSELESLDCEIIIADHHEIGKEWTSEKLFHINPEFFGIPGLSGSGVTYLLAREISKNIVLAPIAVVGTVGEVGESNFELFREHPLIQEDKGIKVFGRYSRPLHKALEFSRIPNVSGDESKALQFLHEIGINPKISNIWRTLSDLTEDELRRLNDAIVMEYLKVDSNIDPKDIFESIWTFKHYPEELKDAKEFATLLNACGRMNNAATGIALCLGSKRALEDSENLLKSYKRMISNAFQWIRDNPQVVKQTDFGIYINAGDNIDENIIGTIISMLSKSTVYKEKPIIGLAKAQDGTKVSARSIGNVNINEVLMEAALLCGGMGGGHCEAAGCTIPQGNEEKFIDLCDELIQRFSKVKLIKI